MRCCRELLDAIGRRQPWDVRSLQHTPFRRSLSLIDLMGLGIGGCGGVGVYVLSAHVTRHEAGPSSVLSVIIAGVTTLLAGLCHAELAGRLPRAGTGYSYCYVTLGELCAFVVGWTVILEHAVTAAVAAKAWRHYLDYMVNDTLSREMDDAATWRLPDVFETQPDVVACIVMLVVSLASFLSVKAFSVLTLSLVVTSGFVLLAFVCVGYFHVQAHNWTRPPGFFAFGFAGMMSGASLMMSVFTGVDQVAAASQETRDPSRHLPPALPLTTALLFLTLLLSTSALTLACPWQDLADHAPIARAFETKGIYAANHVIGVGALLGLAATALSGLFHPPRIMQCMAADGLLPRGCGRVSMSAIPVAGALLSGMLASVLALTLDFRGLIEMSAIGTLLQFLTSAIIVLHVRYQPEPVGLYRDYSDLELSEEEVEDQAPGGESPKLVLMSNGDLHLHYQSSPHTPNNNNNNSDQTHVPHHYHDTTPKEVEQKTVSEPRGEANGVVQTEFVETSALFAENAAPCRRVAHSSSSFSSLVQLSSCTKLVPDAATWHSTRCLFLVFLLATTCLATTSALWPAEPGSSWWAVTLVSVSVALLVASALGMARQPQSDVRLHFKAPYVPLLPLLSVLLCTLLLAYLPSLAWLRFAVWTLLGLVIYSTYGIRKSVHRSEDEQEVVLFDISKRTY